MQLIQERQEVVSMAKGHNRHREQRKQKKERLPGEGEKRREKKITAIVAGKGGRKAATRDARARVGASSG